MADLNRTRPGPARAAAAAGAPAAAPAGEPLPGERAGPAAVAEVRPANPLLFLREEEMRQGMELLYFGYRGFTAGPDAVLGPLGFGRAHHRVLYFIGRNPEMTVSTLLGILCITKQSLSRVLKELVAKGLVRQRPGPQDRRQRRLSLTPAGEALERDLFEAQRQTLARAYREAGAQAVEGFRRVLLDLADEDGRSYLAARGLGPARRGAR